MDPLEDHIIKTMGIGDDKDRHRYETAKQLAWETDTHVSQCFRGLIELEKNGLIQFEQGYKC